MKESVDEGYDTEMHSALRDFLIPTSNISAADTAKRIDATYRDIVLAGDPLLKFKDDKGMSGLLNSLWETVFGISLRLPYNGPEQDKLIEFIGELQRMPPKPFEIWDSECYVYTTEPFFYSVMNRLWNHNSVQEDCTASEFKAYQEYCEQWVNFSAFLARCTAAGLDRSFKNRIPYPSRDLEIALEETAKPGLKRDYIILAATQYISLAHSTIYGNFNGGAEEGSKRKI